MQALSQLSYGPHFRGPGVAPERSPDLGARCLYCDTRVIKRRKRTPFRALLRGSGGVDRLVWPGEDGQHRLLGLGLAQGGAHIS